MKKSLLIICILIISYMNNIIAQNTDYLFMVEQAVKAPSGHNTQPWLFKINDSSIEIHPNFERSLPIVDPDNRELFISLGCALENLCIAAYCKGYNSEVTISGDGIITIVLAKNSLASDSLLQEQSALSIRQESNSTRQESNDFLLEQIAVRQTNRSVYNKKKISSDTINLLKTISSEDGIKIYFYENGTPDFDSISGCVLKGNTVQMQDEAFRAELKSWMRYNKKHQDKTNDGLSYAVFGAPNLPMFIVKPIMSGYINEKKQNKGDIEKMQSSSHFVLFTTQDNAIEQWINLGRTLERFLLKSTGLNIIHAYLNQPNVIKDLSLQMLKALNITEEYPAVLIRIGYGEKLPYSKRKDINEVMLN